MNCCHPVMNSNNVAIRFSIPHVFIDILSSTYAALMVTAACVCTLTVEKVNMCSDLFLPV